LFNKYLDCNRWKYDPSRGISIDTKNPQKANDVLTANPKQHTDLSGPSQGSRLVNGRSSRILEQKLQQQQETDKVQDLTVEDAPATGRTKKGKTKAGNQRGPSTASPIWTPKLNAALLETVKKYSGKTSNGGIAWNKVVSELNITLHHCKKQWQLLEQPQVNQELSSSDDEEEEDESEKLPSQASYDRQLRDQKNQAKLLMNEKDKELSALRAAFKAATDASAANKSQEEEEEDGEQQATKKSKRSKREKQR